ncbi:VWA domain-containing protein, partial [Kibdelosporangium lantanae]
SREEVTMLPFNTHPTAPRTFTLPESAPQAELDQIKSFAGGLVADGGTAIYDSLTRAYQILGAADADHFTSIVLMTDGENQNGSDLSGFQSAYQNLPHQIPVFTVLFGEGSQDELNQVATLTGGKVFDARNTDLTKVFQEIRGYQ